MVLVGEMVYENLRCILRVSKHNPTKVRAIDTVSLDPHESLH